MLQKHIQNVFHVGQKKAKKKILIRKDDTSYAANDSDGRVVYIQQKWWAT